MLIRDHLEKYVNDIELLYNQFKSPLLRNQLTETLVNTAIQFLPKHIVVDPLSTQTEFEVLYDHYKNITFMNELVIIFYDLKKVLI